MLQTLDYNSVILNQYHDVEKSKQRLGFFQSGFGRIDQTKITPLNVLRKVNTILTSQLIYSKGLLISAQERREKFKDKDLSKQIDSLNSILNLNIVTKSLVEELLGDAQNSKYPELHISKEVIEETIENYYSILRILKKANLKISKETSQLARDLSQTSTNTLEKVLYGR